ncbi:MAG: hypothetical protein HY927_13500 [Elusimicrobia bacterium]|nr:hypothetical protein [Elusimicrobiota bacterium]
MTKKKGAMGSGMIRIDWNPRAEALRGFGAAVVVFAVLVGTYAFWKERYVLKIVAAAIAAAGILTAALPEAVGRPFHKAWMAVAFVMGTVVSQAVLALIYYVLLTPTGLILRLFGRDALRLKRGPGPSYWTNLAPMEDKERLERLF